MPERVILIGGGAHAFSILDMLKQASPKYDILGYVDIKKTSLSLEYLGSDEELAGADDFVPDKVKLVMGIGVQMRLRKELFTLFKNKGYKFLTYTHPASAISPTAECSEGSVIFPGVILGPGTKIQHNVSIHSNAVVEHRTVVEGHGYISPGVSIAGDCHIGESCFFGINSSVVDSVSLCADTIVGAGAVVLRNCDEKNVTLVGVPARILKR